MRRDECSTSCVLRIDSRISALFMLLEASFSIALRLAANDAT
jgi:hypothetical protein